jgi:arylsulfatase
VEIGLKSRPRPSLSAGRKNFTYSGSVVAAIPNGSQPNLMNTSYTITAEVDVPEGGASGMLVNLGGRYGGYGLYLLKGKPVFTYNLGGIKRTRWEGPEEFRPGKHTLVFDYKYDGLGFGEGQHLLPSREEWRYAAGPGNRIGLVGRQSGSRSHHVDA